MRTLTDVFKEATESHSGNLDRDLSELGLSGNELFEVVESSFIQYCERADLENTQTSKRVYSLGFTVGMMTGIQLHRPSNN